MKKTALIASLFLVLLGLETRPAAQRDEVVDKILEHGSKDPRVMQHLEYLTQRIGPRLTGSPNLDRACEWTRARFAAFGLQARTERWGEFPVGFERGPAKSGGMVAPIEIDYVFTTFAWTPGTPGPLRAAAISYPRTIEELHERAEQYRGAWVVDLPRSERPKSDVRKAIDAVLLVSGIAGRVVNGGPLVITDGNYDISTDSLPTLVTVRIEKSYFEDLTKRLAASEAVELEFDIDNRFLPGPMPQFNVIADIVGSEFPEQYVIVGGHIDSWDGAEGAQDNGTGVATTLEAARLLVLAGAKPRRTIRFMLWSGEEQGLLGSGAYVKAHPEEMANISAVLVHDGGTNYLSGLAGPPALVGDLRWATEPLLTLDSSMPFEVRENEGLSGFGASDHSSFTAAGVPGFFWDQTGRASYDFVHHTQHDVLENAVPEYQIHSSKVVAVTAYNLAMLDRLLDRTNLVRAGGGRDEGRRRMGVSLEENQVTEVVEGGVAEKSGLAVGDFIVAIEGVEVAGQREIVAELQKSGPKKAFKVKRGDVTVDLVLDWTGTASEIAREKRAKEEAEKKAAETPAPPSGG